jgi:hypothetical protein
MRCSTALTCATLIACLGGCASGIRNIDTAGATRLTLADLRPGQSARLGQVMRAGKAVIVRLEAGDELPLRLRSRLGPVSLVTDGRNRLRCERALFLYVSGRQALIGPDGKRWAALGDWRAMRRLFGLRRGGTLRIGFSALKKKGAVVEVALHGARRR